MKQTEPEYAKLGPKPEHELLIADALRRMQGAPRTLSIKDRRGFVRGRMKVMAWSHTVDSSPPSHYWLCRCLCGNYELRKGSTLGKKIDAADKCEECKKTEHIQHVAQYDPISERARIDRTLRDYRMAVFDKTDRTITTCYEGEFVKITVDGMEGVLPPIRCSVRDCYDLTRSLYASPTPTTRVNQPE